MPTNRSHLLVTAGAAAALLGLACAKPAPAPRAALTLEQAEVAAEAITGESLRSRIAALSDDAMAGRGPGSDGDLATRAWLVAEMTRLGFEPAGDNGSWEQVFGMVGVNATMPEKWVFQAPGGRRLELARHDDFIAGSGVQAELAKIDNAELVFVGYGIDAPEYSWNDFDGGADLTGKVLVILNNDPDWDPALFEGEKRLWYGRWDYKYIQAAKQGAAGAIIIHTVPSAGYPFSVVQTSWSGEQFEVPAGDEPRLQVAGWTTEDAARKLVALGGHDLDALTAAARERDFVPVSLGVTTSMEMPVALRKTETANVLGILRGEDPELSDEVVLFSAHHDHLGIGLDADGDNIYNGAVDNASGCAQVLAIAESFTKLPQRPRRSILLNFVGAEEQGLIGSKYWAANPTLAPGLVAAAINIDGGNIWGRTRDVTSVGHGKSPDLDALLERLAGRTNRTVLPDQFADRGFYYRSDQFAFARVGIPAIYLDGGTDFIDREAGWGRAQIEAWEKEKYHQPSDELDETWVFDGMVEDAKLLFLAGVEIAEADTVPRWRAGDEFEAARLEALAEVAGLSETPATP